ncbi:sugar ABC transporter permease [Kribbella sp. NPDC050459]|uniref:carbohydrate ABC transporter permease n=1 Tax=Kribbella sp. NPDC050459 TaxID=3155785 RepID=UPI00340EB110
MFFPFLTPAAVLYLAFMVAPTLFTVWLSFNSWPGVGPMTWKGFGNYAEMVRDPVFRRSFVNTFWIVAGVGVAVFAVSFALTMILQDVLGKKAVRLIVFFPSLVPAVVISILWGYLFNPDGVVNKVLGWAGVQDPPLWLAPDNVLNTILLGMVWLSAGTYTVIFMAAADRIPKELYEVAELAGANIWQRFTHVTLPLMWDVVSVCAVLWCVAALKTFEFLLVFAASSGTLPPVEIWNFAMYSYAEAFDPGGVPEYGAAAASAVIVLMLTAVLTVLARRVMRRDRTTF